MDSEQLNTLKYKQFVTDPAFTLFLYLNTLEINNLMEQMVNCDKDDLFLIQSQIKILKKLPDLMRSRAISQNQEE